MGLARLNSMRIIMGFYTLFINKTPNILDYKGELGFT